VNRWLKLWLSGLAGIFRLNLIEGGLVEDLYRSCVKQHNKKVCLDLVTEVCKGKDDTDSTSSLFGPHGLMYEGGKERYILQCNGSEVHNSVNNSSADNGGEGGGFENCVANGRSILVETQNSYCKVPSQQVLNGFQAMMDFEKVASAYLDSEDEQEEDEVLSDTREHFSTQTLEHTSSSSFMLVSTKVQPLVVIQDGKSHSCALTEFRGPSHKLLKSSASQLFVNRNSSRDLEQRSDDFFLNPELQQEENDMASSFCPNYSNFDTACISAKSTREDCSWGLCSAELNLLEIGKKLEALRPSTLQDCLCTGSRVQSPQVQLKVDTYCFCPAALQSLKLISIMLFSILCLISTVHLMHCPVPWPCVDDCSLAAFNLEWYSIHQRTAYCLYNQAFIG
jgi:hypothetical protein